MQSVMTRNLWDVERIVSMAMGRGISMYCIVHTLNVLQVSSRGLNIEQRVLLTADVVDSRLRLRKILLVP